MFNNDYCKSTVESVSERIVKIGQRMANKRAKVQSSLFPMGEILRRWR